jgi:hypothetical protein
MHRYLDQHGVEKYMYFDTTRSLGREKEDFLECIRELSDKDLFGFCGGVKRGVEVGAGTVSAGKSPHGRPYGSPGQAGQAGQAKMMPVSSEPARVNPKFIARRTSSDPIGQTTAHLIVSICRRIGVRMKQLRRSSANR